MNNYDKYKINVQLFKTKVKEIWDFQDEPILTFEQDSLGLRYISYLLEYIDDRERRAFVKVSYERYNEIIGDQITIRNAFLHPEDNNVYIVEYFLENGAFYENYAFPVDIFESICPIPEDYVIDIPIPLKDNILTQEDIIEIADSKRRVILDVYMQCKSLMYGVKPFVFNKFLFPLLEIIKDLFDCDQRLIDKRLVFDNIRQGSFGFTIEIASSEEDHTKEMFIENEKTAITTIVSLLNAEKEEDLTYISNYSKEKLFSKDYIGIIKSIIDNDMHLETVYADPIKHKIVKGHMNKKKAENLYQVFIKERNLEERIFEVLGNFYELDISHKEPSFAIKNIDEESIIRGKFDQSILTKIANDFQINLGKKLYRFKIKETKQEESIVHNKEVNYFLLDYNVHIE